LKPGVPVTLSLTANGVTLLATVTFSVSASGGVNFNVDSKTTTADSSNSI
jgi:hypothetical protein